jgi:hypothetical protein
LDIGKDRLYNLDTVPTDFRAFPVIAWVISSYSFEGGQDTTGETLLSTVNPGFATQRPQIILGEKFF